MRGSGLDIGPHCPNGSTQKCVMSLICIKLNQTKQSSVRLSGSVRPECDVHLRRRKIFREQFPFGERSFACNKAILRPRIPSKLRLACHR